MYDVAYCRLKFQREESESETFAVSVEGERTGDAVGKRPVKNEVQCRQLRKTVPLHRGIDE